MCRRVLKRLVVTFVVLATLAGAVWLWTFTRVHQHCIKAAAMAFRIYAQEHEGALPSHENGFGDALLLLVKEDYLPTVASLCAPGDDGTVLERALEENLDVPEEDCSRIYVQGLRDSDGGDLCVIFDRHPTPGGDHRFGMGPPVREVCLLDCSMQTIPDGEWPKFSTNQVELLVKAGLTREAAMVYYPEAKSPE